MHSRMRKIARQNACPILDAEWTSIIIILSLFITFCSGSTNTGQRIPTIIEERQSSSSTVPLIVTNNCQDTIYPGLLTQSGTGPGTGGFALTSGSGRTMLVSENWQGRVWGRTNCSFNSAGTAPGTSGNNGRACVTGDCGGIINCQGAGQTPTSLAEFTLDPGYGQTFYDISLVDGYNLPLAIVVHPDSNSSLQSIPPRLTNPSCVGSVGDLAAASNWNPYSNGNFLGTNESSPLPFDTQITAKDVADWCPSALEVNPESSPSGGVYIYPDGNIDRPLFDPCYSACAKYDQPADCCTGSYDSPSSCSPSAYSKAAKSVCPDAYSYAFDDQTSTFIIPAGAGFEVIFCPGGRSTNILATSKSQLTQLAQSGTISTRLRSRDGLSFFVTYDEVSQTMGLPIRSKAIEITSNSTRLVVRTAFSMLLLASIIWVGL